MNAVHARHMGRKGQSMVETAIAVPVLLMLILGVIQGSMIAMGQLAVQYVAYESVRQGAIQAQYEYQSGGAGTTGELTTIHSGGVSGFSDHVTGVARQTGQRILPAWWGGSSPTGMNTTQNVLVLSPDGSHQEMSLQIANQTYTQARATFPHLQVSVQYEFPMVAPMVGKYFARGRLSSDGSSYAGVLTAKCCDMIVPKGRD